MVLDVGSGGGIDTILAARRVGPEGRAIGLDVLKERGDGGHPPARRSVDVVISNGVLNLSARNVGAMAEGVFAGKLQRAGVTDVWIGATGHSGSTRPPCTRCSLLWSSS